MVGRAQSKRGDAVRRRRVLFLEQLEDRRLLAVDWRNPADSLDVNRDGEISPIDALLLINDINRNQSRVLTGQPTPADPYLDPSGDSQLSPIDILFVINQLNLRGPGARTLGEGSLLAAEDAITVTVGGTESGTRTMRLEVDASFDISDTGAVEDVFAVYVVDPSSPSVTLLDRGQPGTAVFTLAGTKAEFVPGLVRWDGRLLELDLSSLAARDTARLKLQLLNSDLDRQSRVTVRPLSNDVDLVATPGPWFPLNGAATMPGTALNTSQLLATNDATVLVGNVSFDSMTGRYQADIRLRAGDSALGPATAIVLANLPAGVSVVNASGTTDSGAPYVNVGPAFHRGGLGRGMTSDALRLELGVTNNRQFKLAPLVLASENRAPVFMPVGPLSVTPGDVLSVPLAATDPDGDLVTFSLTSAQSLPTGRLTGDGRLEFQPKPNQLGSYTFTLVASDGLLDSRQDVTLNVVADPLTTTRVSGRVLDVDQTPLAGVRVELGAVQVLTQADGSFLLDMGNGPLVSDTLKIRGELFPGTAVYPFIAEKLPLVLEQEVFASVNNVIRRPIFLPKLDIASGRQIDPMHDTTVATDKIPGASVFVAAGTLMNQQGTPFTGVLSITEVPRELTPAALPANLRPDLVVTIQPGEMVFATPAPLSLPNRLGYASGTRMNLWSINPVSGQFDNVGTGKVSSDGLVVTTISGGIRNSSWHFFAPDSSTVRDESQNLPCEECELKLPLTSEVGLHSGALYETHALATYQSLNETRGIKLHYDSLRADPRPIVQFSMQVGFLGSATSPPGGTSQIIAKLAITSGGVTRFVPSESGDEHLRSVPPLSASDAGKRIGAGVQADFRDLPTGAYFYSLDTGIVRSSQGIVGGTTSRLVGRVISVNGIGGPLGNGWGIVGLRAILESPEDGSVLIVDGDGSELLFDPPENAGEAFRNPLGHFGTLEKLTDGTFRHTLRDRTVHEYDVQNRLSVVRDRIGNEMEYGYDSAGLLTAIVDPAGYRTTFTYLNGRVDSITDPAGRITRFEYDLDGNLTRVIDPDGAARVWAYDANHRMISETDALGRLEQVVYDSAGRVQSAIRKDGSELRVFPSQTRGLTESSAVPEFTHNASFADATGRVEHFFFTEMPSLSSRATYSARRAA